MLSKHNIIAFFMSNDTRLVIAEIAMAFYILNFYEDRIALIIKEKTLCEQFCVLWMHGEKAVMFIFALNS